MIRDIQNIDDDIENPALSLKELWFRYEKDSPDILRGLNLEIPSGSISAIVGGNGAGKSTTLKAICGICKPYRGKIKVLGKPVGKFKSGELFRNCISMLPQDPKSLFVKNMMGCLIWHNSLIKIRVCGFFNGIGFVFCRIV